MGQKNHATSWDKKKLRNLSGQKKCATYWDKTKQAISGDLEKSCNLLGQKNDATSCDKKMTQPLGTKNLKIMQLLSTKKHHATSWDNIKKSCNLLGQKKLRNLLRQKKITQPFWTKKRAKMV